MSRTKVTVKELVEIVSENACPGDFNCRTWNEVEADALLHVDGVAAYFDLDEDYEVIYP